MPALVLKADTPVSVRRALDHAKEVILLGGLVAVPTESFYGLAVNAMDEQAIRRLISIKKRPEKNPILILVPSADEVDRYVAQVPPVAVKLIHRFWPGGLTLVFRGKESLSPLLTSATGQIGVRLSSHPIPTGLARLTGVAITGTSANVSGEPPSRSSTEVLKVFGHDIDVVIDGGETEGGKASTVLDVTVHPPEILREGMVSRDSLLPFLGAKHIEKPK
jgi:L-threonylcarbamoyladenylate synthase